MKIIELEREIERDKNVLAPELTGQKSENRFVTVKLGNYAKRKKNHLLMKSG